MATLQNLGVLKYRDKSGNWKPLPVVLQSSGGGGSGGISTISGKGQPTESTVGRLNQLYRDEDTQRLYICTAVDGGYTWAAVSGGGTMEVDETLTQPGQAADAKAAGDAIGRKADTSAVSAALAGKANTADVASALANKANKSEIPSVPSWAMAATKPTYTAAEVGALPSTTVIPDVSGKVDKQQGVENAGMILGVDEDGNVTPLSIDNDKINSFLFELSIDETSGIVPIYAEKGDNLIFATIDGTKFEGGMILFYDAIKKDISNSGWNLPTSLSKREIILQFATSDSAAFYISTTSKQKIKIIGLKAGMSAFEITQQISSNTQQIESNTQQIESNTQQIESIAKDKWIQGSLYDGILDPINKICISYTDFIKCKFTSKIKITDNNSDGSYWKKRFLFYDDEKKFISQDGYWKKNIFEVPENAAFLKISISLMTADNKTQEITPADYADGKLISVISYSRNMKQQIDSNTQQIESIKEDINGFPSDSAVGYYSGAKIIIEHEQNLIAYKKYMEIDPSIFQGQSIQGCAEYGNVLFVACNTMSVIAIYDLINKKILGKILLEAVSTYHCNSMNFGTERYSEDDLFPMLYISMENIAEHKAVALRITQYGDEYNAEIKQIITYPVPSSSEQYYPNCSLDNRNGYLFVKGYIKNNYLAGNGNAIRVRKFKLPKITDGDVSLTIDDALQTFDVHALNCTQGEIVNNGKLIGCYGADWAGDKSIHIAMIDPDLEKMVTDIVISDMGYRQEPESIFIWNNQLYILDVMGGIYQLFFP